MDIGVVQVEETVVLKHMLSKYKLLAYPLTPTKRNENTCPI